MKIEAIFCFLAIILVTLCLGGCRGTSESQIGHLRVGKNFWNMSSKDVVRFKDLESKIEYVELPALQNNSILYYSPKDSFATVYITDEVGNYKNSYDLADDGNFTNYRWKSGNQAESLRLKKLIDEIKSRKMTNMSNES